MPPPRSARLEAFGAIIHLVRPRALVFVDRALARRRLRLRTTPAAWADPTADGNITATTLSAPLEAHLQITNHCAAGCKGCYTGAAPVTRPDEWGLEAWMRAIDELAAAGVFHVALGGGESATLPWLGDLARHARARGVVPNLTTSGLDGLDNLMSCVDDFGQINVSLDGLGSTYQAVRGFDGFARAESALRRLRARKREVGINVVVTRHNFAQLDAVFAFARALRLSEVEILRFKPSGRGAVGYAEHACSQAQHRALLPTLLASARRHRIRIKVDCSYTPMLTHHQPGRDVLASLAVYGCTGGDFLIGAKANGALTACSFAAPPPVPAGEPRPRVTDLQRYWHASDAFAPFRSWRQAAAPCSTCAYLDVCRGGCRVVSAHVAGSATAPDPECPRVVDFHAGHQAALGRVRLPVV